MKNKKSAFTILELSITIAIIALIVGAISAGSTLMNASKLRSLISTQNSLQLAVKSFKMTYNALPGDYNGSSVLWASATCVAGNSNSNSSYCDGNNDNMIAGSVGSTDATAEGTRTLQHLSLAGLIPGAYVGGSPNFILGTNIFPTSLDGAGYNIQYSSPNLMGKIYNNVGNYFVLSRQISNAQPGGGAISPQDAAYIDKKIDDGLPAGGTTLSYNPCDTSSAYKVDSCNACTQTVNSLLQYVFTETQRVCVMTHLIK
jgi:prepilin-type N-terminal cleavage/methylation domain-containing protein